MSFTHADMHVHLDQFANPKEVVHEANMAGTGLFCATTTPDGFMTARNLLAGFPNVRVGAGLHPWWLADGRCAEKDISTLERLIPETDYVGEIGLDYLEKHALKSSWELQREAFSRICATAGATSGATGVDKKKVLTIHSVRATDTTLAILEETGCLEHCVCIFHWFSDSTGLLWDAIHAGCYFSLGERSLRTGKGREYIKLIPANRLLFETDMPWPGDAQRGYSAIAESLERAETAASLIIGVERVKQAAENATRLLSL